MLYNCELTDTFGGEANYSWVKRASIDMPDLTWYGYDGQYGYVKANDKFTRQLIRKAKKALGISGRHKKEEYGDMIKLTFGRACIVAFITW